MPRFSLRTLIVVMLLGGPVLAMVWWARGTQSSENELHYLGYCGVAVIVVMSVTVLVNSRGFQD